MNNQEILDGNKLIAEFMKLPYIGKDMHGFSGYVFDLAVGKIKGNVLCYASTENMQFHSSWDWLMPVVHKCYKLQYGKGWSKSNCLQYCMSSDYFMAENAIELVYKEVIEFIKWYNKNKEL